MIIDDMNSALTKDVNESELEYILKSLQKGKIPSPNGLTIELFLGFYDLLKEDLLLVVKESQRSGKVLGSLNSTFISLIPKTSDPKDFDECCPISCCNLIYKLIANKT